MIKNCDGTPYKVSGSMTQFDPENPEHNLLNSYDQEVIQLFGSPIFYYELFIQKQTIDPLYREDRGKIWASVPIQLFCSYDPIPSQNYISPFGIDSPDEIKFEFNYRAVLKAIGHPPKVGSRLFTPHKRENWVIVQRNVGEFRLWGELRLIIIAQRFQESTTTGEGKLTQPNVDFKLNESQVFSPEKCN